MPSKQYLIQPAKGKKDPPLPSSGLLLVTPSEAAYGHRVLEEAGGSREYLYNSRLTISKDNSFFVAGPSVGAPMAGMTLEKLSVLGANAIILFGWCGSLNPNITIGDLVVGDASVSGEGTSTYYQGKNSHLPSDAMRKKLQKFLDESGTSYETGRIWSTDAPYREEKSLVESLVTDEHVSCVDMEYSALCAISRVRKIDFAALFLVSDELFGTSWKQGFTTKEFRIKSQQIIKLLLQF